MKKGVLYLNSFYESKSNSDTYRISIARGDFSKIAVVNETMSSLAPSKELFAFAQRSKGKNYNWFATYSIRYCRQLEQDKKAQGDLEKIMEILNSGKDVELLCFCRSYKNCHRSLIGKILENLDYDVIYE